MISNIQMNDLVTQLKVLAAQASGSQATTSSPTSGFENILSKALNETNSLQAQSENLSTRFEQGDNSVNLVDVSLASQKAQLSFMAITQVRNRLVSAYQEIMNMQV